MIHARLEIYNFMYIKGEEGILLPMAVILRDPLSVWIPTQLTTCIGHNMKRHEMVILSVITAYQRLYCIYKTQFIVYGRYK